LLLGWFIRIQSFLLQVLAVLKDAGIDVTADV